MCARKPWRTQFLRHWLETDEGRAYARARTFESLKSVFSLWCKFEMGTKILVEKKDRTEGFEDQLIFSKNKFLDN